MQSKAYKFDITAITLSGLCLTHCLLLPILVSSLPLLSVLSEAEWIHQLLVVSAIPVSLSAFAKSHGPSFKATLPAIMACLGIGFLMSGAFIEALHDMERALTVIGALTLATAHIWRWNLHTS